MKIYRITIILLVIFSISILIINYIDISKNQRSVGIRKLDTREQKIFDYNNSKIVMKCFIFCDFTNIPCMIRHREEKYENVLFKGDALVCDLNYWGMENQNLSEMKAELWFYKEYTSLQEDNLNLSADKQQFYHFLKEGGEYKFILAYLLSNELGWEFTAFTTKYYAYENTDDYDSRVSDIQLNDLFFILSIFGLILAILLDSIYNPESEVIKINSKKYTIRVYKKGKKRKK